MNPKKNKGQIIVNSDHLIHGRPDLRGLEHETVEEYLARGGRVNRVSPASYKKYLERIERDAKRRFR